MRTRPQYHEAASSGPSVDRRHGDMGDETTTISAMLSVRNGARAVEFYKAAFGAEQLFRVDGEDGGVVAKMSVAGAEFWLADESPEHHNYSPETLGGGTARMVMVVSDPDAVFARAVAAGATTVWPVQDEYGWRLGRVVDPFGHIGRLASHYRLRVRHE